MAKPLVIVESPAKARTIAGILGNDFVVESSIGHIRDLPRNAAEVPAEFKGEPWARDGVDPDSDFKTLYVVPREKTQQIRKLKALLKDASELYLATDEDREGESISWHLKEVLAPQVPVRRMVFHEITKAAIERAVTEFRDIDLALVEAQETRRILDRLYGFRLSEVLWKKSSGRSAGRVQSVATRIVVERERARMRFRAASYWDLQATFDKAGDAFTAVLVALDGKRLATGRDFTETGEPSKPDVIVLDESGAHGLVERLTGAACRVRSVEEKPYRRSPAAPFMTSTLQQEAGRKLGFGAQRTMRAAQSLYENGYITYMRTDSTTLSEEALTAARAQAAQLYGREFVPEQPRRYAKKVKNAQEAHEAIRPAGEAFRLPEQVARQVSSDEGRLYDLIWKRTVASQMADAVGRTVTVRIAATSSSGEDAEFATSGTVVTFAGFQRAYVEGADDTDADDEGSERRLPALAEGDAVDLAGVEPRGHSTQPPARFTEASLVKALEELGVGRPSTYASIMGTIQDRGYVWKKGSALVPSFTAFAVVQLLERHFEHLVDYGFTASMEDDLDRIAAGEAERVPWLRRFYFGNGAPGLKAMVSERLEEIDAAAVNTIQIGEDAEGRAVVVRVGKYGPYVQRGEERASLPDGLAPDELTVVYAEELLAAPSSDRVLGPDPETGLAVLARAGRYGPYVQMGEIPEEAKGAKLKVKPRTSSLFASMSLDTITLQQALELLRLPRVLGADPADGEEVTAQNGRYGPYVSKGKESRSLEREEQLLTVTLEEAQVLLAQPKPRRGQARAAAAPLKELGEDPVSGKPVVVKEGRFGPYVTDGETNASLRTGDDVATIGIERAAELLRDRRERGPVKKKKTAKKKSAAAKKPAAKKSGTAAKATTKAKKKKAAPRTQAS